MTYILLGLHSLKKSIFLDLNALLGLLCRTFGLRHFTGSGGDC